MSTYTGTIEQTADLILKGIQVEFENELRRRFEEVAKDLVRDAAYAASKNVVVRVDQMDDISRLERVVVVRFNDQEVK
jgi:hypothetical protein